MKKNNFPIDWTSTQLEGAIPGITEAIGYDVPLSCKFVNEGAPKFIYTRDEISINYDMTVEVYDQALQNKFLDIHFHGLIIKFKMELLSNMTLMVDWESIHMTGAEVVPYVNLKNNQLDAKIVMNYFNWAFDLILPWVNALHPANVSRFEIPSEFPGLVSIRDMKLEVRDNYINFQMSPRFLVQSAHHVMSAHRQVRSTRTINVFESLVKLLLK